MRRQLQPWLYIIPFIAMLTIMPMMALLTEDQVKSESENRNLQQFPGYRSIVNLRLSNQLDAYVSDQLPYRDEMVKKFNQLAIQVGKRQIRNLYITGDSHLIQLPPKLKHEAIDVAVDRTSLLAKKISSLNKDLLFAFTPKKSSGLQETLIGLFYRNHMTDVDYFVDQVAQKAPELSFFNLAKAWREKFTLKQRESFYYHTDSHWKAPGAMAAFELLFTKFNQFQGFETSVFDPMLFEYREVVGKPFLGDFNRQLQFQFPYTDTGCYYPIEDTNSIQVLLDTQDGLVEKKIDELYASGVDAEEVDYNKLYTSNYGYYKIKNSKALNPTKLLILKDSYQNAMLPFFVKYFSQIEVVDQRYVLHGDCYSILEASDADAVLVLYNDGVVYGDMFNWDKIE